MIANERVSTINETMAAARLAFVTETQAADRELFDALAVYAQTGGGETENWNMVEAHNKYRNRIEAAAFTLRLAFLKAAGRRE